MTLTRLRIVTITNDIVEYPDYERDTLEFPYMVSWVGCAGFQEFVMDPDRLDRSGQVWFWPVDEFFYSHNFTEISVNTKELYGCDKC